MNYMTNNVSRYGNDDADFDWSDWMVDMQDGGSLLDMADDVQGGE